MRLPNPPADSPSILPQSSTAGVATAVSTAPSQPLPTETPPMRQRLGEDLFRLVQVRMFLCELKVWIWLSRLILTSNIFVLLQHINYMSLMEVLGASFSNLQLAQQSSSLAQSSINSSHPSVPSSYATNFIPQPNALPVQTTFSVTPQTQACVPAPGSSNPQFSQHVCMFADQPAVQSSVKTSPAGGQHHTTRKLLPTANGERVNYQVLIKCHVKL